MGPTRIRDVVVIVLAAGIVGYVLVINTYRWFPPLTIWTGLSLAAVAVAEAVWGGYVRARINAGEIGDGGGRLHPIAVARTVVIAQASAWVGGLVLGWWLGVLVYLLPRRAEMRVAAADTPGAVVAAVCALALVVAALWLQHCCKSPLDSQDNADAAPES
ncbi:MAG: DUF3180 domain-containing protein [Mycobacterium sp.]|jgi:hypothetical protein|nr:DUF3180 domain-containing protein [Mycobacterium sp.]